MNTASRIMNIILELGSIALAVMMLGASSGRIDVTTVGRQSLADAADFSGASRFLRWTDDRHYVSIEAADGLSPEESIFQHPIGNKVDEYVPKERT
jgi:hypothetical protein